MREGQRERERGWGWVRGGGRREVRGARKLSVKRFFRGVHEAASAEGGLQTKTTRNKGKRGRGRKQQERSNKPNTVSISDGRPPDDRIPANRKTTGQRRF